MLDNLFDNAKVRRCAAPENGGSAHGDGQFSRNAKKGLSLQKNNIL
jgi:hypothetical protein